MPDIDVAESVDVLPYVLDQVLVAGDFREFLEFLFPGDAFAGIAYTHLFDVSRHWTDSPPRSIAELHRNARAAVALDPQSSTALTALGWAYGQAGQQEEMFTSLRRAIEVGATASEVDVRRSKDGKLVILHDATLDRTTNAKGPASALTLEQLQQLDAGSWFDPAYHRERTPSLVEAVRACQRKIDVLLDLKEQGDDLTGRLFASFAITVIPRGQSWV